MSADAQFKALIDRILRCREAEDEAKADTREVYAELKGMGYDKAAAGALVNEIRKQEKDSEGFAERNAMLELYRDAYERASGTPIATHVHAPARTEAKRASSRRAEVVTPISHAPAEPAGNSGDDIPAQITEPDLTASPDRPAEAVEVPTSDTASANNSATPQSMVVEDGQPGIPSSDDAPAQKDDEVPASPSGGAADAASGYGQSEQAVASFKFKPVVLRPNCQRPENCGGYGSKHCASCERAGREVAAA